jgi:hypothetical protein
MGEWINVQPLFPHKDLERTGIPYETKAKTIDFHASGRRSDVTGLPYNGANITEAKELARHADVRMTMRHTHIGLDDQAATLAGLPLPAVASKTSWPGIGRDSGGVTSQAPSADGSGEGGEAGPENEKTPAGAGVSSFPVSASQEMAVDVTSGGGGNKVQWSDLLMHKELRRVRRSLSDTLSDTLTRRVQGVGHCIRLLRLDHQ